MLDRDRPDGVRLGIAEARALGETALQRTGYPGDEAAIITDQLIDNAQFGYRFASLPRILAIAEDEKTSRGRRFVWGMRRLYQPWSGLSFAIQALGLLAGAAPQDYGFLFIAIDPAMLVQDFPTRMAELVTRIKATPRQPGIEEIRIPSERAFREREQRRNEGIVLDRKVVDALNAL
jgi:LDH2 family malate/lactate/ureidoglycolate dehydrogenase